MAGPSLHKGSCIDPAAREPQDHIKLDLVPVFLPTKELWARGPKTLVLVYVTWEHTVYCEASTSYPPLCGEGTASQGGHCIHCCDGSS